MQFFSRVLAIIVLATLCACGGGGTTTTIPPADPIVDGPAGTTQSVALGGQPTTATLPTISEISTTLFFPAVATPATIALSASATAPPGIALESVRRAQSGTLTVYEYVTCVASKTVVLPNIPAIKLHFPVTTSLIGKIFSYGISDLNAQGGLVSFNTQGPATIDGQTVSFAQVPTSITFEAGHKYTFVVYATGTVAAKTGATKIYVGNEGTNPTYPFFAGYVTTYNANGSASTPTITGLAITAGVAVDAAGKVYVADDICLPDGCFSNIASYKANGDQTTPSISTAGNPSGVAVDVAGKIYVAADDGTVTTYNAAGIAVAPTITAGLRNPNGVAVDAAGKIYVVNDGDYNGTSYINSSVTIYNPDGTQAKPTITTALHFPVGVAVDASGKIYVANQDNNTVTTYNADGTQTTPTITAGLHAPQYLAVDGAGKIYVVNGGSNTVTTYNPDGTQTTPTITIGLDRPAGIAVR